MMMKTKRVASYVCGEKVLILGVLDNGKVGLTAEHQHYLAAADVVIGATRTLALFAEQLKEGTECYDLTGHLKEVPAWIEAALVSKKRVVVLATGDPLCHGIANYLVKKVGLERLEIIPNTSAIQLACARFGVSWQDAFICSIHSKDAGEWVDKPNQTHGLYPLFKACLQHEKIVVLTSPENSPARIARMLLAEGWTDAFEMQIAENLLQSNERLVQGEAIETLATETFADLNVVLLQRKEPLEKVVQFGLEDGAFHQRKPEKGLITKREVRAVSLAMLQLKSNSMVWDIGAGSGSVGLEAARLCPDGWVYAMEKNEADFSIARSNQIKMGIHHYSLIHGKAPHGLDVWPNPDAVFVGGSGGELGELIRLILSRLKDGGHLVMNFVTLENLSTATEALKAMGASWSVTQMQISRSKPILHMHRMAAENPVWIVTVKKE